MKRLRLTLLTLMGVALLGVVPALAYRYAYFRSGPLSVGSSGYDYKCSAVNLSEDTNAVFDFLICNTKTPPSCAFAEIEVIPGSMAAIDTVDEAFADDRYCEIIVNNIRSSEARATFAVIDGSGRAVSAVPVTYQR